MCTDFEAQNPNHSISTDLISSQQSYVTPLSLDLFDMFKYYLKDIIVLLLLTAALLCEPNCACANATTSQFNVKLYTANAVQMNLVLFSLEQSKLFFNWISLNQFGTWNVCFDVTLADQQRLIRCNLCVVLWLMVAVVSLKTHNTHRIQVICFSSLLTKPIVRERALSRFPVEIITVYILCAGKSNMQHNTQTNDMKNNNIKCSLKYRCCTI